MDGSKPGTLSTFDLRKILTGAAIAGVGAAAASIAGWATVEDFNWQIPAAAFSAAFFSVLANAARKLLTDTRE